MLRPAASTRLSENVTFPGETFANMVAFIGRPISIFAVSPWATSRDALG